MAVTVYTAGAAAQALGVAGAAGGGGFAGGAAVFTAGQISTGLVASAAIGGAAGSIASQAVGMAIGNVDQFSWKAVAQSAIGAGAGSAAGQALNAVAQGSSGLTSTILSNPYASAAITGAGASALAQVIEGRWSWREVAASAAGSAAGRAVGEAVSSALSNSWGTTATSMASKFAGGLAAGWTSEQVKSIDSNYTAARLSTMYAGALGGALAGQLTSSDPLQGVGPNSSADYRSGVDIDTDNAVMDRLRSERYSLANGTYARLGGEVSVPQTPYAPESGGYRFSDPASTSLGTSSQEPYNRYSIRPDDEPLGRQLRLPDIGKVLLPGSYGGDYTTVSFEGNQTLSADGGRLTLPQENVTLHRGGLGRADQVLADLQAYADAQVQRTQDQGAEAYAQGRTLAAADAALAYFPQRLIADAFKGLVGLPRLYTSDMMLPGLVNAASHPLDTAGAIGRTIANNSASENIILGTELLGPAVLKVGSPALARLNGLPGLGRDLGGASSSISRLSYVPSSGIDLIAKPGSTTTILGSYSNDMRSVVNELGNVKSVDFGPRVGGLNVLNVPDNLYAPKTFWGEYNRPWLGNAIDRGDNFLMATPPGFDVLDVKSGISVLMRPDAITGKMELSGFGREYLMMRQSGYIYQNGLMVKK